VIVFAAGISLASVGLSQTPSGDVWLFPPGIYSPGSSSALVESNLFTTLHAEAVAGKMHVTWAPEGAAAPTQVVLRASTGGPGHWPARDWRSYSMACRDTRWSAVLPIEEVSEPMIYFVRSASAEITNVSPMRLLLPREAGMEEPTRPFWPFVEGFEEGFEGWDLLPGSESLPILEITAHAKTGKAALNVRLPAGRKSLTIATTRLRGWRIEQRQATGVCLWLRTAEGPGRARFSVLANAFAPKEVTRVWPKEAELSDRWQRVDLYFDQVPAFPLGAIDLFSIEFVTSGAREFLVDDLQLLGPWNLDFP
jgi:hypothetical protein